MVAVSHAATISHLVALSVVYALRLADDVIRRLLAIGVLGIQVAVLDVIDGDARGSLEECNLFLFLFPYLMWCHEVDLRQT